MTALELSTKPLSAVRKKCQQYNFKYIDESTHTVPLGNH